MKYNHNMTSISIDTTTCTYEIRKDYGGFSTMLDRVSVHGANLGELAQKLQTKASSGCYGEQYYKQMFVCVHSVIIMNRIITKLNAGLRDEAKLLFEYLSADIENSGMDTKALWRMVGSFAAQWGATKQDTWEVLTKFCK